jgi:hypothetical protein
VDVWVVSIHGHAPSAMRWEWVNNRLVADDAAIVQAHETLRQRGLLPADGPAVLDLRKWPEDMLPDAPYSLVFLARAASEGYGHVTMEVLYKAIRETPPVLAIRGLSVEGGETSLDLAAVRRAKIDEDRVTQLRELSKRLRPHARHAPASDSNATARAWSDVRATIEWFSPYRQLVDEQFVNE